MYICITLISSTKGATLKALLTLYHGARSTIRSPGLDDISNDAWWSSQLLTLASIIFLPYRYLQVRIFNDIAHCASPKAHLFFHSPLSLSATTWERIEGPRINFLASSIEQVVRLRVQSTGSFKCTSKGRRYLDMVHFSNIKYTSLDLVWIVHRVLSGSMKSKLEKDFRTLRKHNWGPGVHPTLRKLLWSHCIAYIIVFWVRKAEFSEPKNNTEDHMTRNV